LLQVNGRNPFAPTVERRGGVLDLEYMKSFGSSPLVIGGSAIPGANVKHRGKLMPVFATREQPGGLAFALPALWLYERVAGARLLGKAPPGKRVVASLDFHEQGRAHVWRAYADAGPGGDYELVIPFPTALVRPTLATGARYALRVDEGPPIEVAVPERAVRDGGVIPVAPLRSGTGAQLAEKRSRSVKTAPAPSPLATEITPPKDSAIP
ncbi:MAG TPA: hypothetical protein VLT61_00290, partial [Anaeromyxobacteraceae bacterium]|nr:hypothetical protein [Anaeromyxobacteraceae bacterium]